MENIELPSWREIAREEQLISPKWKWLWLILAGRGFGKTRTGAETIMELVNSGKYKQIAIIGRTIQEPSLINFCQGRKQLSAKKVIIAARR